MSPVPQRKERSCSGQFRDAEPVRKAPHAGNGGHSNTVESSMTTRHLRRRGLFQAMLRQFPARHLHQGLRPAKRRLAAQEIQKGACDPTPAVSSIHTKCAAYRASLACCNRASPSFWEVSKPRDTLPLDSKLMRSTTHAGCSWLATQVRGDRALHQHGC